MATKTFYICKYETFSYMHKIFLQQQNFIIHSQTGICGKNIYLQTHTFRYVHAIFFHMHTNGDTQLQAVKLFVNIISQAQNKKLPFFLFHTDCTDYLFSVVNPFIDSVGFCTVVLLTY